MTTSNAETYWMNRFLPNMKNLLGTLKERGTELPYSQSSRPVLYLKCWGSDYPYLQRVEQEKRWLPARMDSSPRRLVPD
jgi:hypothetical protein